jgi:hypothetical protein
MSAVAPKRILLQKKAIDDIGTDNNIISGVAATSG